jgi:hypothetical protein
MQPISSCNAPIEAKNFFANMVSALLCWIIMLIMAMACSMGKPYNTMPQNTQ